MKLSIMNKMSTRFQLAFGLTSIVVSLLLFSTVLNLMPNSKQTVIDGRVSLSESIASATTLFLQQGDLNSIGNNLEFNIQRTAALLAATLSREGDEPLIFGDESRVVADDDTESSTANRIILPILKQNAPWGNVVLYFTDTGGETLIDKIRSNNLTLIAFCSVFSFIFFYLYLGKMLKALNPSRAIPGRVRSALDTLAEALIVIDQNSNVVLANKAFQEITGQTTEQLLGKKAESFDWKQSTAHPATDAAANEITYPWQQAIDSSETVRGVGLSLVGASDERHDFLVNCSPILSGEKTSGVLISLDDVTELEQKERELRIARDEAEQANRAKSDFLSNMSHEIRTPMTAILGFTEVLKRGGASSPHWDKHLGTISSSGKHLLELINDVLDLSKVESGALEVEAIDCEPHRVAHDVIQVLRVRANEKDISLDLKIPAPIPHTISSDASRLRQIITNLVGNAIKFTEEGGVEVVLRYIDKPGSRQIAVDVSDSGIGMNEEQQAAVFKPFVQADSSITRRFGGTGLGLSISRKLSQALGGDIVVSSEAGVGTTFTATIDVGEVENLRLITEEEAFDSLAQIDATQHTSWSFPESKLLVIDDAAENRELLTIVLNDLGLEVETAENGAIGVDMAKATHYDVILSDIQMPVMDGYETVKVMREIGQTQPIIALTANAMKGYEQRVLDAGFSHYMTKPIDIDALAAMLAKLLGGTAQEATAVAEISAPAADPKFRPIVLKFLPRLQEKVSLMENARLEGDYEALAELAHWLKGSGGMVGYDSFTDMAAHLEESAKERNSEAVEKYLAKIKAYSTQLLTSGNDDDLPSAATHAV